ncbi:MAG TPA: hypothetical protein VF192_01475 [Longimicrobiales bacterium]
MDAVDRYMIEVDARIARALLRRTEAVRAKVWTRRYGDPAVASLKMRNDPFLPLVTANDHCVADRNRWTQADIRASVARHVPEAVQPYVAEEGEWMPWRYIPGWSAGKPCEHAAGPGQPCSLVKGHPGECV